MVCRSCGRVIPDGVVVCPVCGAKLNNGKEAGVNGRHAVVVIILCLLVLGAGMICAVIGVYRKIPG